METATIECPYCGELIEVVIDWSVHRQEYIEDCHVCCQPITLDVTVAGTADRNDPEVTVGVRSADD